MISNQSRIKGTCFRRSKLRLFKVYYVLKFGYFLQIILIIDSSDKDGKLGKNKIYMKSEGFNNMLEVLK